MYSTLLGNVLYITRESTHTLLGNVHIHYKGMYTYITRECTHTLLGNVHIHYQGRYTYITRAVALQEAQEFALKCIAELARDYKPGQLAASQAPCSVTGIAIGSEHRI